ncbi:uncharacterized protein LOC129699885 [Leucoraja erinacea]|uniref:uncharacterized protein LOC129699885 n=1 Tax=Leucoraja erinaceus TaxID=7782 RepID=UPI00245516AF|nr:uncharacterized protein LOC129699885 [Leucoraja erinacea]
MEHELRFKRTVLPHYLKMLTSALSLNHISSRGSQQQLCPSEETALGTAVREAHSHVSEAATQAGAVLEDLDKEVEDAAEEKRSCEQEMGNVKQQLLQLDKQMVSEESRREVVRDDVERWQLEMRQAQHTQDTENARRDQKRTLRNLGIGLGILPFVGIPLVVGSCREMSRCEALIEEAVKDKAEVKVKLDQASLELDLCRKKLQELQHRKLEVDNGQRERQRELQMVHHALEQLLSSRRKVLNEVAHLGNLKAQLDVLTTRCGQDACAEYELIHGRLISLLSHLHGHSFSLQLLADPRVLSKLTLLDGNGPSTGGSESGGGGGGAMNPDP